MTVEFLVKQIENKSKEPVDLLNQEFEVNVDNVQIEVSKEEIEVKVDGESVVKVPTSSCWESLMKRFRKKTN